MALTSQEGELMKINVEKSNVKEWLAILSAASKGDHYQKLWKKVYRLVEVPSRRRHKVDLRKLETNTKDGDNVVVPGKVLSNGEMTHKINISAIEFSDNALKSLREADCKVMHIKEMVNSKNVRVII